MSIIAKVVLLGDRGVGKTTLRETYLGQGFRSRYLMTLGADFSVKQETIRGKDWKFQIWDVGEQTRFDAVRGLYYAGCVGAILIYDVTRPDSLLNLQSWSSELFRHNSQKDLALIVLANKIDIRQDTAQHVTTQQGLEFIQYLWKKVERPINMGFLEVSVIKGLNIARIFNLLAGMMILADPRQKHSDFFVPPSLFRMPWVKSLDFSSLNLQDNIFCPFCGATKLILGREEKTGLQRGFCIKCENSPW
ncbi:MAG: Rab family GTPase [Candidatus Hermodarchaeota archaeon]